MPFFQKAKPLQKPDDTEHGYQYALFLLNLRLRTEGEMWTKMQTRGYYPDVIEQVVKQLKDEKLIDDERYIEMYIDNMKLYKYYGVFMMKKKLISVTRLEFFARILVLQLVLPIVDALGVPRFGKLFGVVHYWEMNLALRLWDGCPLIQQNLVNY